MVSIGLYRLVFQTEVQKYRSTEVQKKEVKRFKNGEKNRSTDFKIICMRCAFALTHHNKTRNGDNSMIIKSERPDGTIITSGTINGYKDFKECLAGCSKDKTAKAIISEFADKNHEKFEKYFLQVEQEMKLADAKRQLEISAKGFID